MDNSPDRGVLPQNIKPLHYNIVLDPNLENSTFAGEVQIHLQVLEDSNFIELNTKDIEIHSTEVTITSASIPITKTSHDAETEVLRIDLGRSIQASQEATLSQRFTGKLQDDNTAFYRSSWKDDEGREHWIGVTQLAEMNSRRVFPSFDEPAFKATFTITLVADAKMTCLGNMNVASETEEDPGECGRKRKRVVFNKSPLMSTYLVAFIISELDVVETDKFRLPVRVFCTPDQDISHGVYSAELAAKALEFYETEFGIECPLPKMDMVAVPDFNAGAMENWGLVTYRVDHLLIEEAKSSTANKFRLTKAVLHELAHQWFGNLVTPKIWDYLWLNEGFATWMSYYSCNTLYPEWNVWDKHIVDCLSNALHLDSMRSSHPMEMQVKGADEISQIFDSITYAKGSSVIRMISKYLGEDVFMEGIRRYLKKHAYGNTVANDLWAALTEASGKDVKTIASTWTTKVGFPVVTVEEDFENNTIRLKQNRFLSTGDVKPDDDEIIYPIILGLRTKDGVNSDLTLLQREGEYQLSDLDFYKLNSEHTGLYYTRYTAKGLQIIGEGVKKGLLPVSDRLGIIGDTAALSKSGLQNTSKLLDVFKMLYKDPAHCVWDTIISKLSTLRDIWSSEPENVTVALKDFQRDLVSKKSQELGWTFTSNEGHTERQFKSLIFAAACDAGDEKATAAAQKMFERFQAGDRDAVDPELRAAVFTTALRLGGRAAYDAVVDEYKSAKTSSDRNAALACLGSSREFIKRTLEYALSNEVKRQDMYHVLYGLPHHLLWPWIKENWERLRAAFPLSDDMLGRILHWAVASLESEEQKKDVEKFFEVNSTSGLDIKLAQALEAYEAKQAWLKRGRSDVNDWL